MLHRIFKLWLIGGLAIGGMLPLAPDGGPFLAPAAWADDDDDDDDDGDDDDDDDDRPAPVRRAAPPPAPLPERAPNEVIAMRLQDGDLTVLLTEGYSVIEQADLGGDTARRLRIPQGVTEEAARDRVRALNTGAEADFNHYYRMEQAKDAASCNGPHCGDRALIGWDFDEARLDACLGDVSIGIIDTGLNEAHETFSDASMAVHRLTPDKAAPSRAVHGTAVAALLVGGQDSRSPGLVPAAPVIAVDVFHRKGGDERADAFSLIEGIFYLAGQGVDVVNLSLSGPENTELEQAMTALDQTHNIIAIAATGNDGARTGPRYPAAYDQVIAVTAVDRNRRVYRRAGGGAHVDFAAPGVDVWTAASVSGARGKTGTSFAVPFVSAVVAALRGQNPDLTAAEARAILARDAVDLGRPGRDDTYGHGLISARAICAWPELRPVSERN